MSKLLREYPENVYMGMTEDGDRIYLRRPSWDCGWYWGFGYLGNDNCHYHLSGLTSEHKNNLWNALRKEFPIDTGAGAGAVAQMWRRKTLWEFCEVVKTVYTLREAAEVLGRGGAHYTENPCKELIQNPDEVKRLNEVVIPRLIDEMYVALGVVEPMEKDDE